MNDSAAVVAVEARALTQRVTLAGRELTILEDVGFTIHAGEAVAIVGASGSGKSTLIGLLAGLDMPSSGEVVLAGQALKGLDEDQILGAYERSRAHLSQPTLVPKSRAEMMPDRGRPKWPWLFGGVLLVLVAAAMVAYVSEYGVRLPKWSGADAGTPVPGSAAPRQQDEAGGASGAPQSTSPVATGPAEPVAAATSAAESGVTPVAVTAGQVALQLRFAADSWVEIYDGSGKAVLYDLGKAGTERVATGAAPLSVTIGNAPAVTMRVNGRGITLPAPPAGQTVGRYSIGPDGSLR